MKLLSFILVFAVSVASARDLETLLPSGEITAETPSLETAFPGETYILRSTSGDMIHYEVRVYAPEVISVGRVLSMWDVVIVIRDGAGAQLFSGSLEADGICTIPPSKEEFRVFHFSVHRSVEATTAVNIGRQSAMHVLFTTYRLPLKTVDHPKAHL